MPDMDIINKMIRDSAKIELVRHYDRRKVTLNEPCHHTSYVDIYGLPEESIVIKLDACFSSEYIFAGTRGECKRCDYIIISAANGKKVIIYIELKATKGRAQEIIQQLTGARCFITYCREIGRSFWMDPSFLNGYRQRFVSIGHTSMPKRGTRITRPSASYDQPDKILRIDWPHHLEFNHLAGA